MPSFDWNDPFLLEDRLTGTPKNIVLHRDLKQIGDLPAVLRDRRVPVLWRPLHEFSGDWFWWGSPLARRLPKPMILSRQNRACGYNERPT